MSTSAVEMPGARDRVVAALVLVDLALGALVAVEALAARMHVHVMQVFHAVYVARHAGLVGHAIQSAAGAGAITAVVALAATVGLLPSRSPTSTAYGSAAWNTGEALRQPRGLLVGRTPTAQLGDDALRYAGEGHLLTVAPTRSGKGVSAVIPALLTFQGSLVVTDLKGENYAVTARARRGMGQRVLALDPFGVAARESASFNPLDRIDPSRADAIDDAR